jgi:hypothetical protein
VLADRYHQANAKVATITGTTTTSMIAVELIRRSRSAEAIGPCGSSTPAGLQEGRRIAAATTGQRRKRECRRRCSKLAVFLTGHLRSRSITRRRSSQDARWDLSRDSQMRVEPKLRLRDGQAAPPQIACINGNRFLPGSNKTVCARLVMRHSCDVGYLASVPGVQGGSGMRRELRWPVK